MGRATRKRILQRGRSGSDVRGMKPTLSRPPLPPAGPVGQAARLFLLGQLLSCSGASVEYSFNLNQPLNFVMTDALHDALDGRGRELFTAAALHAAEALGATAGWAGDRGHPDTSLPSENVTVQLTLGSVDCFGDRAGYVRWRPNNVLQVCPAIVRERRYLHLLSLVMHEMGHVVGGGHVSCDGESVMGPDLKCPDRKYQRISDSSGADPEHLFWYSDRDVDELCRHTRGGVCNYSRSSAAPQ